MRLALCLLAFCAIGAFAAGTPSDATPGIYGYNVVKSGYANDGAFWLKYDVADSDLSPAVNATTTLNVAMHGDNYETAVGGLVKLYVGLNKVPDATDPNNPRNGIILMTKNKKAYDASAGYIIRAAGTYYLTGYVRCDLCNGDAYVKISANIQWSNGGKGFEIVPEIFTANYTTLPGTFGASGFVDLAAQTDVFVKLNAWYSKTSVIMVFSKDSTPTMLPTSDSDALKRFPSSAVQGSYTSDAVTLSAGRWFITPYFVSSDALQMPQYQFAVGLGHVPSAAAVAAPSALLAAALALVALLRAF